VVEDPNHSQKFQGSQSPKTSANDFVLPPPTACPELPPPSTQSHSSITLNISNTRNQYMPQHPDDSHQHDTPTHDSTVLSLQSDYLIDLQSDEHNARRKLTSREIIFHNLHMKYWQKLIYHHDTISHSLGLCTETSAMSIPNPDNLHALTQSLIHHVSWNKAITILDYIISMHYLKKNKQCLHVLHCEDDERAKIKTSESNERDHILVSRHNYFYNLERLSNIIVDNESYARVDYELDENREFSDIKALQRDNAQLTINNILISIQRTLLDEATTEKNRLLRDRELYLKDLSTRFNDIIHQYTLKKQIASNTTLYNEKGKLIDPSNPLGLQFTNKLVLPIPETLHHLLDNPILQSLHRYTTATLHENIHTLTNITTNWNRITRIYEHPIKGIVLVKLEHPIPYICAYSNKPTNSHNVAFSLNMPGRTLSAAAWSTSITLFKSLDIMSIHEFNLHCMNKVSIPTCLQNTLHTSILSTLLDGLHTLQAQIEQLGLSRLQALATINKALRSKQGTIYPTPIDYANRPQDKPISSIRQHRHHITSPLHLKPNNDPINALPQTKTITELIIKWNLAHNLHTTTTNSLWTDDTNMSVCTDILTTLRNPPTQHKLPDDIPAALNDIFHIDAQLDSNPINSHFSIFTSGDHTHKPFGGTPTVPDIFTTLYSESLDNPEDNLDKILQLTNDLASHTTERNIILATTPPNLWQSDQSASFLKNHPRIHKIADLPPDTVHTYYTDTKGNSIKYDIPLKHHLVIWLIHSPHSRIDKTATRNNYFTHLKRLKKNHKHLNTHPIFSYSSPTASKLHLECSFRIKQLIKERHSILHTRPINWELYHITSTKILNLLPHTTISHPNIAKILNLSEIRADELSNTYLQKGAYIYAIFNYLHNQNITYIGQTGMYRKKTNKMKKWQDLERAPLQRMQEHIASALSHNNHSADRKKTASLYRHMCKDPEAWIMIPLAYIPTSKRSNNRKIEDRWWREFFPKTYNDLPPNGTTYDTRTNHRMETAILDRIDKLTLSSFIAHISRPKVRLSPLECIAAMNKFHKHLTPYQKDLTIQAIKRKAKYTCLRYMQPNWCFHIPLQTKHRLSKIKQTTHNLIKHLDCPSIIKDYIRSNINLYFRPTKRIIDLVRMDREFTDSIKYSDIETSPIDIPEPNPQPERQQSDTDPTPTTAAPDCRCHTRPHSSTNLSKHTFIRTDDPAQIRLIIKDIPDLAHFEDILVTSPQDRVHLPQIHACRQNNKGIKSLLRTLPGSKNHSTTFQDEMKLLLNQPDTTPRHSRISTSRCKQLKEILRCNNLILNPPGEETPPPINPLPVHLKTHTA